MTSQIYLDNNATTALDPRVFEVLIEHLKQFEGNPSSIHASGKNARAKLIQARDSIAAFLGVRSNEIFFTSSATEALNSLIRGIVAERKENHIITSTVEHAAVYSTIKFLEKEGCQVSYLSPEKYGAVTPEAIRQAITPKTSLIAIMAVNNETGVKTDIEAIASIAYQAKISLVVDGVALLGKEPFKIYPGISAFCFSGHKIHAPKGIAFSFVRNKLKFKPLILGGEQEYGLRGGTENLPGIIALAKAISLIPEEISEANLRMSFLRDKLETSIMSAASFVLVNGEGPRISNVTNLAFPGLDAEVLLTYLDQKGISVSHGSACSSGALEPSRVLLNMGISPKIARTSIRFSLSRMTTEKEIDAAINIIIEAIKCMQ